MDDRIAHWIEGQRGIPVEIAAEPTTTLETGQTAAITVNRGYSQKVHIKVSCSDGTFYEGDWTPAL